MGCRKESYTSHEGTTLCDFVTLFPTPTANRYGTSNNGCPGDGRTEYATKGKMRLETMAKTGTWSTPTTQDAHNNNGPSQQKRNILPLNAQVGGKLNPMWVAWLMGWPLLEPIDSECWETEWSRYRQHMRSALSGLLSDIRLVDLFS